jgi:accessory gene regulator protein AgrB
MIVDPRTSRFGYCSFFSFLVLTNFYKQIAFFMINVAILIYVPTDPEINHYSNVRTRSCTSSVTLLSFFIQLIARMHRSLTILDYPNLEVFNHS